MHKTFNAFPTPLNRAQAVLFEYGIGHVNEVTSYFHKDQNTLPGINCFLGIVYIFQSCKPCFMKMGLYISMNPIEFSIYICIDLSIKILEFQSCASCAS